MITQSWNSGVDDYKKYTLVEDPVTKKHQFLLTMLDVPVIDYPSVFELYDDLLSVRQTKFVDVLYSGGLDSELVLYCCLKNKIPAKAITMRLLVRGCPINLTDLYYSEKFCRANNVEISIFKRDLWESLGYKSPELRLRSDGWEFVPHFLLDMAKYRKELQDTFGITESKICWGEKINALINAELKCNDRFR